MAERDAAPLTDAERAELEELRAEKARREAEARARAERAELEQLRAEQKAAAGAAAEPQAGSEPAGRQASSRAQGAPPRARHADGSTSASVPARPSAAAGPAPTPATEPVPDTFGRRMVTSHGTDEDGVPKMPPAQKLIIVLAFVCVVAFVLWTVFR